ncbi:hypothetical protein CAEBREN_06872 [Caenorhabditis brenneri]|uniref:NTF2-like domain-containing protein n=1 Tax=Caenorhabditis brenneri TaxID=135651 RepID=G0NGJ8_CAEBE|nr:hypothetical protein CAEBREN_06872 [Caenorhabditis brenneri]
MWSTNILFFLIFLGTLPVVSDSHPTPNLLGYMQKVVKFVSEGVISRKNETLFSWFHTDFKFKNCYDSYDRELLIKILLSESKKDFALKIVEYDTRRSDRLKLLVKVTGFRRYEKIDAEFLLDYGRNKIMSGRQMDCEDACRESDGDKCVFDWAT